MSKECDEYIRFVTKTIRNAIDYEYSVQGRNIDDITGVYASKRIDCLKKLAEKLGVELE